MGAARYTRADRVEFCGCISCPLTPVVLAHGGGRCLSARGFTSRVGFQVRSCGLDTGMAPGSQHVRHACAVVLDVLVDHGSDVLRADIAEETEDSALTVRLSLEQRANHAPHAVRGAART